MYASSSALITGSPSTASAKGLGGGVSVEGPASSDASAKNEPEPGAPEPVTQEAPPVGTGAPGTGAAGTMVTEPEAPSSDEDDVDEAADDELELAVPVWVADARWLPGTPQTLVVGTGFVKERLRGEVRLYDVRAQRRPGNPCGR